MKKNILVTGGSGFIGSAIVEKLAESEKYNPVVVDRKIQPWISKMVGTYNCYEMSIQNFRKAHNTLDKIDVECVIHLAAYHSVSESIVSSKKYHENNVGSLLDIISMKPKKIILASSAGIYGSSLNSPSATETATNLPGLQRYHLQAKDATSIVDGIKNAARHPIPFSELDELNEPTNPYVETKLLCETILNDWHCIKGISMRIFNAAGGSEKYGYVQDPPAHLIPIIIKKMFDNTSEPFKIYGSNHHTTDGTCVRDFVHIKDIANAFVLALDYNGEEKIFNVGSGVGKSVLECIDFITQLAQKYYGQHLRPNQWPLNLFDYVIKDKRDCDPAFLVANNELIKKELKWNPSYTFEDIMYDAIKWEKTYRNDVYGRFLYS